ncbi:MAG: hypothetical protein H6711_11725 [Myxococcales bacterium]|nr:hypothetical protein [Myxococcales bacterium]
MSIAAGAPLHRLHELLRGAAIDGFAGVMSEGLGAALRSATDALAATTALEAPWDQQLRHFRGGLDRFEERGQHDRSKVVAHGLRIVAVCGRAAAAPSGGRRRVISGPTRAPARGARGRGRGRRARLRVLRRPR